MSRFFVCIRVPNPSRVGGGGGGGGATIDNSGGASCLTSEGRVTLDVPHILTLWLAYPGQLSVSQVLPKT